MSHAPPPRKPSEPLRALSRSANKLLGRLTPSRIPPQRTQPGDLQVLLALPGWSVMRSTDRDYVYERLPQLNAAFRVRFHGNFGFRSLVLANTQYTIERVAPMIGVPFTFHGRLPGLKVDPRIEVIFSYGQYPTGLTTKVPILWEQTFAPQRGVDVRAWIALQRQEHMRAATGATRVVTATHVSAQWFCRIFPEHAHKINVVPYYLPHLSPASVTVANKKAHEDQHVRVAFIGKEARRKGLETLAEAWPLLSPEARSSLQVTVVSAMLDGRVSLPPEWTHHDFVSDVTEVLRNAHVLAFPTQREAYGLVLVEGMAAGCAIITAAAPVQQCIVGDEAGIFVDPTSPTEVAGALAKLLQDRALLGRKMTAASERFRERYAPEVVGLQYTKLLYASAGRSALDDALRRVAISQ